MTRECLFIGGPLDGRREVVEDNPYYNVYLPQSLPAYRMSTAPPEVVSHTIVKYRKARLGLESMNACIYIAPGISDETVINYILHSLQVRRWSNDS